MIQPTFSEVIKVKDGIFYNLPYHYNRINRTSKHFFDEALNLDFNQYTIPENMRSGLVKCRIVYGREVLSVEFSAYLFRKIEKVAIVYDNNIDYTFKCTDRSTINSLVEKSGYNEIIIVKNGFITDASSSNLVFKDATGLYTPDTYLLGGTKRECLLENKIIAERRIKIEDIRQYSKLYFINAMIDLEDEISINTESIIGF